MYNKSNKITLIISFFLITGSFSGCIEDNKDNTISKPLDQTYIKDSPSILPNWTDGFYHDYYNTIDLLNTFQIKYPELVNVFSIGTSVKGRNIWCIRITNENNNQHKFTCLIDGCIHGCEWEAGEACLYIAEYLLINFDYNSTTEKILNNSEIYIIPILNPDGRQSDYRYNDNGIDLNRNFGIDFGRLRGHAIPLGKLFGRIKIPYLRFEFLNKLFPKIPGFLTNSGRRPFSEPETKALRDFMYELNKKDFSFYVACHTAVHNFASPWSAFKPPFSISKQEEKIFDYVKNWIDDNSEYENTPLGYYASGTAADWCFKEFNIPSFTFEILSKDYEPGTGGGKHDNLVHWMKTTMPVFMYLFVNIENLKNWNTPDNNPILPDGIPPPPLS